MPAFIGGQVVLAPRKETAEVLQRDASGLDAHAGKSGGRWSPRTNSSDEDAGGKGSGVGRGSGSHLVNSSGGGGEGGGGRGAALWGGGVRDLQSNGSRRLGKAGGAGSSIHAGTLGNAGSRSGDQELGAWGNVPQRNMPQGSIMAPPSIWSDDET